MFSFAAILFFLFLPLPIFAQQPLWQYEAHPHFWPVGPHNWVAKKFLRHPATPDPGYDVMWVWSGPYVSGGRFVIYREYPNNQPGPYGEWELWTGDPMNHTATVHKYGGRSETEVTDTSTSKSVCESGQTGIAYPNIPANQTFALSPESHRPPGQTCSNEWQSFTQPGGYTAVRLKEYWPTPYSPLRQQKCEEYLPSETLTIANRICKGSPDVGILYQRYARNNTNGTFIYGCEVTVYAWEWPFDSSFSYRSWMRNGELRWSHWRSLAGGTTEIRAPDDDTWWDGGCSQSWTAKPNFVYAGVYELSDVEYIDNGSDLFPTATPTPSPTHTPIPTNTPSPIHGDVTGDRKVNVADILKLLTQWKSPYTIFDYVLTVANYGR